MENPRLSDLILEIGSPDLPPRWPHVRAAEKANLPHAVMSTPAVLPVSQDQYTTQPVGTPVLVVFHSG